MACFTRKPLARRITNTLCWSLGLIIGALLLSGHFVLAFMLTPAIAIGYLCMMMLYKKMEAISVNTIESTSVYTAKRTVNNVIEALKSLLEERNKDERIDEIQDMVNSICLKVSTMNDVLNDHILPEMGIYLSDVDEEDEGYARELLNGKMIELANLNRMDVNIKMALKTAKIKTNYQKYIVFFSNFAHMKDKQRAVRRWFATAYPKHKIRETIVSSETTEYAKNVKKLCKLKSKDKTIDLIYSCEMLNMGYHVDNLTGIIMYRSTYSNTVYAQQLGRALSTGDARPKIVFDVVDNVHRKSKYTMFVSSKEDESGVPDAILEEYKALVKKQNSKNRAGNPVKLTQEETDRLVELKQIIAKHKKRTPKSGSLYNINQLYYDDLNLIATGNEATYREFIGKAVAEIEAIPCRRAWERWVEKGGDCRIMTRDYILAQKAPKAVPLPPFCRAKNVAVQAVLDVMGVK